MERDTYFSDLLSFLMQGYRVRFPARRNSKHGWNNVDKILFRIAFVVVFFLTLKKFTKLFLNECFKQIKKYSTKKHQLDDDTENVFCEKKICQKF